MKIGDVLKKARIEKGLTYSQIAKEIFIQEKYLRALEEGEYDIIPGEAYQRAYFRAYAEYLGLGDFIENLTKPHKFKQEPEEKPVEDIFGGVWDTARIIRVSVKLGIIILAVILIFVLPRSFQSSEKKPQPDRRGSTQPLIVTPIDEQPNWKSSNDPTLISGSPDNWTNLEHELTLIAHGQCWVVVKTNDKYLFQDLMTAGQKQTFNDIIGFYLKAGMPENLEVIFNGQPIKWEEGQREMILPQGASIIPPTK